MRSQNVEAITLVWLVAPFSGDTLAVRHRRLKQTYVRKEARIGKDKQGGREFRLAALAGPAPMGCTHKGGEPSTPHT